MKATEVTVHKSAYLFETLDIREDERNFDNDTASLNRPLGV